MRTDAGPINFTVNRVVDAVFVVDIILAFFMPYRASQKEGGMMVFDNAKIVRAYLRSWFCLDLFTVIPFDLLLGWIAESAELEARPRPRACTPIDARLHRRRRALAPP